MVVDCGCLPVKLLRVICEHYYRTIRKTCFYFMQKGDIYSNVVVVQHDPELVTPGDAAFALECDFSSPRDQQVNADYQARDRYVLDDLVT